MFLVQPFFLQRLIMVKNEQSSTGLLKRTILVAPPVPSLPPPPPVPLVVVQPVTVMTQRLSDPYAIDITSRKGQFAWEKIAQSDTYTPVIFRYVRLIVYHILTNRIRESKKFVH
jgi:hypothetical protein